MLYKTMVRSH